MLLRSYSAVVSKYPGLTTRKWKPAVKETAVQLAWLIGTWDAASFFMFQPGVLPRPGALFTSSGKQKHAISQLQASKSGL